jgi:hypothetical protein
MADEQTNPKVPADDHGDDATKLPQDTTDEADVQNPLSPHSIAPQIQDEEAEKADVVEEQHDVAPAADEEVSTDTETAEKVNEPVEKPKDEEVI